MNTKKLSLLFLILFLTRTGAGFNYLVPLFKTDSSVFYCNTFVPDSIRNCANNPAIIDYSTDTEFSLSFNPEKRFWYVNYAGIRYSDKKITAGLVAGFSHIFQYFPYRFEIIDGFIGGGKLIGRLNTGIGLNIMRLYHQNVAGTAVRFFAGIKTKGRWVGNEVIAGLGFKAGSKINWEEEYINYKKLPSEFYFDLVLKRNLFFISTKFHYLFPVLINQSSNFTYNEFEEEARISVATGFILRRIKIVLSSMYVSDGETLTGGAGVEYRLKGLTYIYSGVVNNQIFKKSENKLTIFEAGIRINLKGI